MTDEEKVLQAIARAQDVLAAYIEPGPRDEKLALSELMVILDDNDLIQAHKRLARNIGTRGSGTKQAERVYYDAQRKRIEERKDTSNGK